MIDPMKIIAYTSLSLILSFLGLLNLVAHAGTGISTEDWERREIIKKPDLSVETVVSSQVLGAWSSDGFSGPVRFVITHSGGKTNRLYVQWLESTEIDAEVAYSISIREFNVFPEFELSLPVCGDAECNVSTISAKHVFEGVEQKFLLTLTSLGRYKVGLVD